MEYESELIAKAIEDSGCVMLNVKGSNIKAIVKPYMNNGKFILAYSTLTHDELMKQGTYQDMVSYVRNLCEETR